MMWWYMFSTLYFSLCNVYKSKSYTPLLYRYIYIKRENDDSGEGSR